MSRAYLLALAKREDAVAFRRFLISAGLIVAAAVAASLWGWK